jgi:hypothetical protein
MALYEYKASSLAILESVRSVNMRSHNKGNLYSSKSGKLEAVDMVSHKSSCAKLRNFVAEMFLQTHKGHIELYHAIDSYEREPELHARIKQLEKAVDDLVKNTGQSNQNIWMGQQAIKET